MSGLVNTLVSVSSTIFLIANFYNQLRILKANQIENIFFKMMDYHRKNVENLKIEDESGIDALCILREQILYSITRVEQFTKFDDKLLVIDIAYTLVFFGTQDDSIAILREKFSKIKNFNIEEFIKNYNFNPPSVSYNGKNYSIVKSRQEMLGHYFRNLYNTINFIDSSKYLTEEEKYDYVKVLRSQFSNPELSIIFFNSLTEFSINWKEKNYINKYKLIKNLPYDYCGKYNSKDYYNEFKYEYEE